MATVSQEKFPLKVQGISKAFKQKKVLDSLSFDVREGEIFGLIGMNGVGKTTLIKIILDLLRPDQGDALLFGKPVTQPESRRNMTYLPEKFAPSPFLKGKEFLSLAVAFAGKQLDMATATEWCHSLDLDPEALHKKIGKYSKGMGQKLGLASVFLSDASLLILDEPMSGLDPRARIHLKDALLRYKQSGKSVFFSSHILADIEEICDRVAVLHDTKLVYVGDPHTFRERYEEATLERSFLKAVNAA